MPFSTPPRKPTLCVGTVLSARYAVDEHGHRGIEMKVSLGSHGTVTAQENISHQYELGELIDRQVIVAIHPAEGSTGDLSERVTILGANADQFGLTLLSPDRLVPSGTPVNA